MADLAIQDSFIRQALILDVIDGDTVVARVDLGYRIDGPIVHYRLTAINCPEVHGDTKEAGLAAKQFTYDRIFGKTVQVLSKKLDTFESRWLGDIFYINDAGQQIHLNKELLDTGHAVRFMVPSDWIGDK